MVNKFLRTSRIHTEKFHRPLYHCEYDIAHTSSRQYAHQTNVYRTLEIRNSFKIDSLSCEFLFRINITILVVEHYIIHIYVVRIQTNSVNVRRLGTNVGRNGPTAYGSIGRSTVDICVDSHIATRIRPWEIIRK